MQHDDGKRIIRFAWYDSEFGVLLSQSELLHRGWKKSSITKQLGEPDCYGLNPMGGAYVRLYSEKRVRQTKFKLVST